jgi:molybdopterin converting factor small subunit
MMLSTNACGHGETYMKIRIKSIFAVGLTEKLRSVLASGKDLIVEVEPGTRIQELLEETGSLGPAESFDDLMIHVFINGNQKGFDYELKPGDVLDVHLPVSGG